jgi:ankyrin repeat protein
LCSFYLVHLVCRGLLSEYDARRESPLNDIIRHKLDERVEIVKYLYGRGASIDQYDHDGLTPFMYACSSGNYELVRYLLDEQQNRDQTSITRLINERSTTGETCLMYAIESGNIQVVTLLCKYDAQFNDQASPSYITAAAFYGHRDILEKLIQLELDVNEFSRRNIFDI